jgi:hypothetical protein
VEGFFWSRVRETRIANRVVFVVRIDLITVKTYHYFVVGKKTSLLVEVILYSLIYHDGRFESLRITPPQLRPGWNVVTLRKMKPCHYVITPPPSAQAPEAPPAAQALPTAAESPSQNCRSAPCGRSATSSYKRHHHQHRLWLWHLFITSSQAAEAAPKVSGGRAF